MGGATTKYLVDTVNPTHLPQVPDETVNGSVTRTYAYGLQRISENQLNGSTWMPGFYRYDGHGNVRFVTNSASTVTDTLSVRRLRSPHRHYRPHPQQRPVQRGVVGQHRALQSEGGGTTTK